MSRKSGKEKRAIEKEVYNVLDIRLTKIDKVCDIGISHHLLKVGYAVRAKVPSSMIKLRRHAESLSQMTPSEFKSVSSQCRAELKAFGVAILRSHGINIRYSNEKPNDAISKDTEKTEKRMAAANEEDDGGNWYFLWMD